MPRSGARAPGLVSVASISGQLTQLVGDHGMLAVATIMAVDAVLPAGGEIVMLFAGALASCANAQHGRSSACRPATACPRTSPSRSRHARLRRRLANVAVSLA